MTVRTATGRAAGAALVALLLCACSTLPQTSGPTPPPPPPPPTKGIPPLGAVRDSAYLPLERRAAPPAGYGLYSVLLARSADRHAQRVLAELLATTISTGEAALSRENLNLITIPIRSAADAARDLASARAQPEAAATALLQKSYDFGQAALLMASLCRPERGDAVMRTCGSPMPAGPLLVTTLQPLDGSVAPGQRILVVNLSATSPEAVREVLASYRLQILRKDFEHLARSEGWRLAALNTVLDMAQLLPGISKAYAGTR